MNILSSSVFKYLRHISKLRLFKERGLDIVHTFFPVNAVVLMKQSMRKYFRYRNVSYFALTLDLTGIRSYKIDISKGQLSKEKLKIEWKVFKENVE